MNRRTPSAPGRSGGFTLFELVLVLTIVAIVAIYAVPRLVSAPEVTLSATASRLAASIRYAQGLAMASGQRYRVNFTATGYQITDMGGAPIVQPVTASTAAVSVSPATLGGYDPPLSGGYVAFDTRGVPYVDATTPLAAGATVTITLGSDTATVAIAPETGSVR